MFHSISFKIAIAKTNAAAANGEDIVDVSAEHMNGCDGELVRTKSSIYGTNNVVRTSESFQWSQ